ncbi:MAG: hypothetical protein NDI61_13785 [Bdellovibrionaceae bacterium]|nr:hypothetical protein [Pseudobdellovibrionaceae bacterium]
MSDPKSFVSPLTESTRRRMRDLHGGLLRLHKILLDNERIAYEKVHGKVETSGQLLNLVMYDQWFDWLHRISEMIVQIDELMENEEASLDDAYKILAALRGLFQHAPEDPAFGAKYRAVLQREPAAVLAHADVQQILILDS